MSRQISGAKACTRTVEALCSLVVDCPHSTPKWTEAGVVVLRSRNIRGGRLNLAAQRSFTTEDNYRKRVKRAVPQGGDIVITREAPMGEVCILPDGLRCCMGQRMVLLRPDPRRVVGRFLLFALQSQAVQRQIGMHEGTGSTVSNLRIPALRALRVPWFTIKEQRRIAAVLGALDDKIELNRKMNRTLEAMAQAIFKSWFIDFDGVPDSEMVESELGLIPRGWQLRSLYSSAAYINGAAYRKFHFSNEPCALPIIKIAELKNGVYSRTKFTTTTLADKYRIDDREMLFSWSGNPDTSIDTFIWTGGPAWLNQHIFRVIPHRAEDWYFIYYLLKHMKPVFAEIARDKQTTGLGHVTARDMKRLQVIQPDEPTLRRFNGVVGPFFERWYANLIQSQTLTALRDTLLPKLISGEIRVPEAQATIAAAV